MIAALVRRLLCRAGHHHVIRCAGAEDHRWTWRDGRWHASLDRVPPLTPTDRAALAAVDAQVRTALRGRGYPAAGPTVTTMPPAPPGPAPGARTAPRHRSTP